jgi:hypothetical protein
VSNLPFLKKKQSGIAGISMEYRKPDADGEGHHDKEDNKDDGLQAAADDIIACVNQNDKVGLAKALRAAFEILDSEPHVEGEHIEEEEES